MTHDELQDDFKIRFAKSATGTLAGVHHAAGHHRQHAPRVQHRRDARCPATALIGAADRPLPRARPRARAASTSTSATAMKEEIWLRGPSFVRFDLTFKKRIPFGRKASFDIQFDLLNAFNNINFNQAFNPGSGAASSR